jgi:CBS domain-containing protein
MLLNEQVRKIMSADPVVANPGQTVAEVNQLMIQNNLTQLPVVEGKKLVGMVTTHDLWENSQKEESLHEISKIMNTKIIKIAPKDKVRTAAELFMDKRFKTLPVVNLKNELKGVITAFDVMRYTLKLEDPKPVLYADVISA